MSWEFRGKHRYFYQSVRINGRPRKIYFGRGASAVAAEEFMRTQREARETERQRISEARDTFDAADDAVAQVGEAAGIVGAAHAVRTSSPAAPPADIVMPRSPEEVTARVRQLLGLRAKGDASVDGELAAILDNFPELWAQLGDMGTQAIEIWLNLAGGDDALLKRAIREKLTALRQELVAAAGDPAARLLADRIVATWLHLHYADIRVATFAQNDSPAVQEFIAKRQQQAQRQHLAALNAWRQWRGMAATLPDLEPPKVTTPSEGDALEPGAPDAEEPMTLPFVIPRRA